MTRFAGGREGGGLRWSTGDNYVTWSTKAPHEIYPRFEDTHGELTPHFQVGSREGALYEVRVYLPPGYDENTLKRYPTLYAHDGANVFVPEESVGSVPWDLDDTHDLLDTMSVIDKVIVVAIHTRPGCASCFATSSFSFCFSARTLLFAVSSTRRCLLLFAAAITGCLVLRQRWKWWLILPQDPDAPHRECRSANGWKST